MAGARGAVMLLPESVDIMFDPGRCCILRHALIFGRLIPAVADLFSPFALTDFLIANDCDAVPHIELFLESILNWLYAFGLIVGLVVEVIGLVSLLAFDDDFILLK